MGARTGRDSLMALGARVNQAREPDSLANVLSDAERDELTVIAYTHLRNQARREFAAERVRILRELGQRVAAMRTSHDEDCGCTHEGTVREHPDFTYRRIETP